MPKNNPSNSRRVMGSRRYKHYSSHDVEEALDQISRRKLTLRQASKKYSIPLGTLSHRLNGKHAKKPGRQQTFSEEEERAFIDHIITVSEWGFPFDFLDIRMMVKYYLDKCDRDEKRFVNNVPSVEWARRFFNRHKEKLVRRVTQNISIKRAGVTPEVMVNYFDNLKKTLENNGDPISPANMINYDETNLSDNPGSKKCVFKRGVKYPERIKSSTKTCISVMFCGSAEGHVLPPYTVYKADNMWNTWVQGGPCGARYNRTASGWFDAVVFSDWFQTILLPYAKKQNGPMLVIGDNLASHFTLDVIKLSNENNIKFVCLPKNATHLCQPLDVAFYGPLKRCWRKVLDKWKQNSARSSQSLSKEAFPRLLKKLMKRCSLLAEGEYQPSQNLVAGFKKSGIHPFNPKMVLDRLPAISENEVDTATGNDTENGSVKDPSPKVSAAVLDLLKEMRYGGNQNARQRRSKINVFPGKSVSMKDFSNSAASSGTSTSTSTAAKSRTEIARPSGSRRCSSPEQNEVGPELESDSEHEEHVPAGYQETVDVDSYVVVRFGIGQREKFYVAKILSIGTDYPEELEVSCLRRHNDIYVFPVVPDECLIHRADVVRSLPLPVITRRGLSFPGEFDEDIALE